MRVRQVMARDPVTIGPDASLATAIRVMRDKQVRHLPVVEATGHLIGIITDRDLRHAALGPALAGQLSASARRRLRGVGQEIEHIKVQDAMTWVVVSIHPEAPLGRAAWLMLEARVGSLPVVDKGVLVGMLTELDVLKALVPQEQLRVGDAMGFLW